MLSDGVSQSRGELVDMLESISDGFVSLDREWRYTFVNQKAAELSGFHCTEMLGKQLWELFPGVKSSRFFEHLNRAMENREAVHFEEFFRDRDRWIETHVYPTRDGIAVLSRDVTDRKRLDNQAAHLAAIVESSEDAIIGKSLDGTILTWNGGAESVYGYPAAEAIGKSMTLLLPDDRADEETAILQRIAKGERVEHFQTVRRTKSGSLIDVSLTISPIRNRAGEIIGASHIARDITERRQFEERLRQSTKLESLGVLAGGVAHDFNNLLVGILGNASLALELLPNVHSQVKAVLGDVVSASERAAHLTRQLLAYAGKGRFIIEVLDLSELVREVNDLIRSSIPKNVQLRVSLSERMPPILADSGQIQQVIMNLVINAAEAIPAEKDGSVLVTTHEQLVDANYLRQMLTEPAVEPGQYVALEVHDNGAGMDEGTLARIFDPFFTTKFTGRGLGLAAVQGIVRGHRGVIRVYSRPGEGTTFKVLLPATTAGHDEEEVREIQINRNRNLGLTILVVDDEAAVCRTAKAALEHHGYQVLVAPGGREAIEIFRTLASSISLVLLDLSMPGMNGDEVLRQLRAIKPDVKVLLSSGFNEVEVIQRFTEKSLAGFIQKPYTSAAVAAAANRALHPS